MLQVRMKNSAAGSILRWTEELVRTLSIPVCVNDRIDVALAAGAAGVHLGADDLPVVRARVLGPPPFAIGVSVGDAREAALAREGTPDYWSVGNPGRSKLRTMVWKRWRCWAARKSIW